VCPRGGAPPLTDLGGRPTPVRRQRPRRVRRRPEPPRARRGLRVAAVCLLGLALQAGGAVWLLSTPRFAVGTVEVRGASRVSVDRILAAAGIAPGANLWRIDPVAVAARVEALPGIRRAELIRELPNRVTLRVEERRPFTLVGGGRLHWLDEEGYWLGEAGPGTSPPAPVITGLSEEEMADMRRAPSPRARAAIALLRILLRRSSALVHEISEIDMSRREGPVLYTVDGIEVRLGSEEWEQRLTRLEGVLGQVVRQGTDVAIIDLRFRDQVVLTPGGAS
jgi:cell division septal protein FtsQ